MEAELLLFKFSFIILFFSSPVIFLLDLFSFFFSSVSSVYILLSLFVFITLSDILNSSFDSILLIILFISFFSLNDILNSFSLSSLSKNVSLESVRFFFFHDIFFDFRTFFYYIVIIQLMVILAFLGISHY